MYVQVIDNCVGTRNKDDRMDIRIKSDVKKDLWILAELRGLKPSSLINSLIVREIFEEKKKHPEAFKEKSFEAEERERQLRESEVKRIREEELPSHENNGNGLKKVG